MRFCIHGNLLYNIRFEYSGDYDDSGIVKTTNLLGHAKKRKQFFILAMEENININKHDCMEMRNCWQLEAIFLIFKFFLIFGSKKLFLNQL